MTFLSDLAAKLKRSDLANDALRYFPGANRAVREAIRALEDGDAETRSEIQEELLHRLLRIAQRTSYGAGRGSTIDAWPILQKTDVRKSPQSFFAPRTLGIPAATSGSTGQPMQLRRGLRNVAAEQAFLDHLAGHYGTTFRHGRIAILRGDVPRQKAGAGVRNWERIGNHRLILAAGNLSAETFECYYSELKRFHPDILWIYPTGGDQLARLCIDNSLSLPTRLVMSSSEMLSDAAFSRISRAFEAPVVDYYGQAERVCLAQRTEIGKSYFQPAYGYVELLPEPPAEAAVPGNRAKVVATGFWNDAMPLVRYQTGDLIEFDPSYGPEQLRLVSLGLLPFIRILGRESEYLLTRFGGRIQALNNIPREVDGVLQAQFIQAIDYSIIIKVIASPVFGSKQKRLLLSKAREKISVEIPIEVDVTESLVKTAGGKTPFVIREVEHRDCR